MTQTVKTEQILGLFNVADIGQSTFFQSAEAERARKSKCSLLVYESGGKLSMRAVPLTAAKLKKSKFYIEI